MKKNLSLRLKPSEAADSSFINQLIADETGKLKSSVTGFTILKKSIDARSRQPLINLTIEAYINEPYHHRAISHTHFPDVTNSSKRVIIVGAGPAGLFAALQLIEKGINIPVALL